MAHPGLRGNGFWTFLPDFLNPWVPHYRVTVNTETGLRVSWFVYRGAGETTFDAAPDQGLGGHSHRCQFSMAPHWVTPELPEDGRWVTQVTFEQTWTYVLRCRVSDGALGTSTIVLPSL